MELSDQVVKAAREALAGGIAGDKLVRARGRLRSPVALEHPNGGTHSWLVPVVVGRQLVGLVQIGLHLEFLRFTSFQRRLNSLEGTPPMAEWFSADRVRSLAAAMARPAELLGKPVLTYDQIPDRLVWRVEARAPSGEVRAILVAGDLAYEPGELAGTIGGLGP
ncbi:MAG: hypothetical protein MUF10_04380 [Thermoanaerobaculaceae bacterium]|jgi:hypothetical protein|nr:hypothetical protein [Thermoanaerobaculaceae bacterium]